MTDDGGNSSGSDDDNNDDDDVEFLLSQHHIDVKRDFVNAVRRQLQRDFSRQRLLTVALNVRQIIDSTVYFNNVCHFFCWNSRILQCVRAVEHLVRRPR